MGKTGKSMIIQLFAAPWRPTLKNQKTDLHRPWMTSKNTLNNDENETHNLPILPPINFSC